MASGIDSAKKSLALLTEFAFIESHLAGELRRERPFDLVFGPDGKHTRECRAKLKAFRREHSVRVAELTARRNAIQGAIRELSETLFQLAVRPEVGEQPSKLRTLMETWTATATR